MSAVGELMRVKTVDGPGNVREIESITDTVLTDATARTYTASTRYTMPGALVVGVGDEGVYVVKLSIQFDGDNWHTLSGAAVLSPVYWRFSGTETYVVIPLDAHNQNALECRLYINTGSGSRSFDVEFSDGITVSSGGFVTLTFRRIM